MEKLEPTFLNRVFRNAALAGGDMIKEAQAAGTDFIRKKLHELSFHRKVMKPRMVTIDELIPRTNSDTFYKIVAKDIKDSVALPIAFVGKASDTYFTEPRYEVDFYRIKSDKWIKSIDELDVYSNLGIPITKIIEDYMLFGIHQVEDSRFIDACNTIITSYPEQSVASASTTLAKSDFVNLFRLLTNSKLRVGTMLMAENTLYDVWTWTMSELGLPIASEVLIDGYKYDRLLKYPVVTTIKRDLVPDASNTAVVWAFAPVEAAETVPTEVEPLEYTGNYLGVSYILKEGQLIVETREDEIQMVAREILGTGIGNVKGVCKLYKG